MQRPVISFTPEIYAVGLSATVGVTVLAGQLAAGVRYISGGSVAIVAGASNIASQGFLLDSNILGLDCSGTFYLAATGSTAIVHVLKAVTG